MTEFDTTRPRSKKARYDTPASRTVSSNPDSQIRCSREALQPRRARYRGISLIWTAIVLFVLILIVGVALDMAKAFLVMHQLQNAADASALAGAHFVKFDQVTARQQAIDIAFENYADGLPVSLRDNVENNPDLDIVLGRYLRQNQTFVPTTIIPNAVKVVARRIEGLGDGPVPLNFGPIINIDNVGLIRDAIAMSSGSTGAGLIALAEYPEDDPSYPNKGTGLQVAGNSIVEVKNGDIQVNSWSEDHPWSSFRATGDFTLKCAELNIRGTVSPDIEHEYWQDIDYSVNEHTGPLPDPLENLPELKGSEDFPDITAQWGEQTINSSVIISNGVWSEADGAYVLTLQPGYYPGGISMTTTNCKLVLESGIYAFGGTTKVIDPNSGELLATGKETGLCINGGTFVAEEVMLYITDSLEGEYGSVDIHGGTHVNVRITEYLNEDSIYKGMAIFQDRANQEESYVTGSTEIFLEGTLYFKNANFRVGGDGLQAGTQLIAGTVEVDGGSYVIINYDGRNWILGYKSFIVK
jgi:Flp pilus assembly protein TadG